MTVDGSPSKCCVCEWAAIHSTSSICRSVAIALNWNKNCTDKYSHKSDCPFYHRAVQYLRRYLCLSRLLKSHALTAEKFEQLTRQYSAYQKDHPAKPWRKHTRRNGRPWLSLPINQAAGSTLGVPIVASHTSLTQRRIGRASSLVRLSARPRSFSTISSWIYVSGLKNKPAEAGWFLLI